MSKTKVKIATSVLYVIVIGLLVASLFTSKSPTSEKLAILAMLIFIGSLVGTLIYAAIDDLWKD